MRSADADGDNTELSDLVRTIYREWKSQRIDEQLDDVVHMAFGRGALAAVAPGHADRVDRRPERAAVPRRRGQRAGGYDRMPASRSRRSTRAPRRTAGAAA